MANSLPALGSLKCSGTISDDHYFLQYYFNWKLLNFFRSQNPVGLFQELVSKIQRISISENWSYIKSSLSWSAVILNNSGWRILQKRKTRKVKMVKFWNICRRGNRLDKISCEIRLSVSSLFAYLGKKNEKETTKTTLTAEGESKVNLANSSDYFWESGIGN